MALLKRIGYIVALLLNAVAALALLVACLSPFLPPDKLLLPAVAGLLFEWLLLVNVLFAAGWLFTKRKVYALLSFVCLCCSVPNICTTFAFGRGAEPKEAKHRITVLSYNTCALDQSRPVDKNQVLHYIKERDCDIVCLQEFRMDKQNGRLTLEQVKRYLNYPYSYIDFKTYKGRLPFGIAVFSKYPLLNKQTIRYESESNISDRCDVVVDGDTIRLLNNHLQSYSFTAQELRMETDNSDQLKKKATLLDRKFRKAYQYRPEQARLVEQEIAASPYPVLVCGDFNDVPVSYVYRRIARPLRDAFLESAAPAVLGHTYRHYGIGVRIDYILHSPTMHATSFLIDKVDYSDHYPVSCEVCW